MAMLRPPGKPQKIAEKVMKGKGVKIPASKQMETLKMKGPYLQH
jgi:hypothetical protein